MLQVTLAIIRPNAAARGLPGEFWSPVHAAGLRIVGLKMLRLGKAQT